MRWARNVVTAAALAGGLGAWANYNPSGDIQAYAPGGAGGGSGNPNGPAAGNVDWLGFSQTSSTGPVRIVAPNGVGVQVVGNANFTGSVTVNGNQTVGAAATNFLQFGTTTKLLAPADGTLQLTTSTGTFGPLLLGASGATTGMKLTPTNGVLTLTDGSGAASTGRIVVGGVAGATALDLGQSQANLGELEVRRTTSDSLRLVAGVHGRLSSDTLFGWSSGSASATTRDTTLYRDSAGVIGINAGLSNTATGALKLALTQYGNGSKLADTADGTFQFTTSTGTFGSLLMGATGTSTGIKLVPSNGALVLKRGDDSGALSLQVPSGNFVIGTINTQGIAILSSGGGGVYGQGGNGGMGVIAFPSATTGPISFQKATGTLAGAAFTFDGPIQVQTAAQIRSGSGAPESAVTGNVGDIYLRTGGGALTTFYVKETGAGTNTGWVAK